MSGPSGGDGNHNWRPTAIPTGPEPRSGGSGENQGGEPGPCDITVDTPLNSPNPAVLAGLKVGDILTVRQLLGPPVLLVAETVSGQVAGSITSASMAQIISCIRNGVHYSATIRSIHGGMCVVRINRK